MRLGITYAYYGVSFSKPDTRTVYKILNNLTRIICKIPILTANILTHLDIKDLGINTTSILPNYLTCISKQLAQALNEPWQLRKVYQGLTKYIATKYDGSLNLPKLKYQACSRSFTTKILFPLEREFGIHIDAQDKTFPFQQTPLEIQWHSNSQYASLPMWRITKIYKIPQQTLPLQDHHNPSIPKSCPNLNHIQRRIQTKIQSTPEIIKEALQQTDFISPTQNRIDTTLQNKNHMNTHYPTIHPITNNTNGASSK